jgi:hypothetical protein
MSESVDNAWSEMTTEVQQDATVDVAEGGADQAMDAEPEVSPDVSMER